MKCALNFKEVSNSLAKYLKIVSEVMWLNTSTPPQKKKITTEFLSKKKIKIFNIEYFK